MVTGNPALLHYQAEISLKKMRMENGDKIQESESSIKYPEYNAEL